MTLENPKFIILFYKKTEWSFLKITVALNTFNYYILINQNIK